MKIAIIDISVPSLDILVLDKETEEIFDSYDDASEFIEDLGYNIHYTSWGIINEERIRHINKSDLYKKCLKDSSEK